MPNPSVTYSFSNATTADATQVNTNFNDLINALTDGLKDISVGTVSSSGTTTLDTILALPGTSTVIATNTGSSTVGNSTATVILAPSGAIASYTLTLPAAPVEGQMLAIVSNGNEITNLTVSANSGQTLATGAGLSTIRAGVGALLQFRSTVWYRIAGANPNGSVSAKTGDYTLTSTDDSVTGDSSGGAFTFTLPTAVGRANKQFRLIKIDSSTTAITIATTSAQTINGASSSSLNTQYEEVTLFSDGANWLVANRYIPSNWVAYTPAIGAGFGTPTGVSFVSRRVGDSVEVKGQFTAGTVAASPSTIELGFGGTSGNISIDTSKTPTNNIVGHGMTNATASTTYFGYVTVIAGALKLVSLGIQTSANSGSSSANGNAICGTGNFVSVELSIPIVGWNG